MCYHDKETYRQYHFQIILIVCGGYGTRLSVCTNGKTFILLFRPGNKASPCTRKDQTTCMNIRHIKALETLTRTRAENGRTSGNISVSLLDYKVLCDEQSTFAFYGDKSFKL